MNNFDQQLSRKNTGSIKWDFMEKIYNIPNAENIIPMWIADMDFAAPQIITEAISKRLEKPIFGYSYEVDPCADSIVNWLERRHNWTITSDQIIYHQGVVPAIATAVEALTAPSDSILVNSPVYPPFFMIPAKLGREVVYSPLLEDRGRYSFDFNNFEEQVKKPEVTMFILCHPHNPAGVAWDEDTLRKIDELCFANNVIVVSDEIHSDLMLNGSKHIPLAKVSAHPENIVTCFAPTKTFNIAGIQAAMVISCDSHKRLEMQNAIASHGQMGLNVFAIAAVEAAFSEEAEKWLHDLIQYLNKNIDYTIDTISKAVPSVKINRPDATYLLWVDIRETGFSEKEIMQKLLDAGVALDPGTKYGQAFEGFLRMNIACTSDTLKEAVSRFIKAFA
ncbi:cystathionine beta-lyase PatB [Kurthia zopfii]|uniref:cysteine-S-conjugate beta-lyase n=1 Tax=Kurthia zopfii TaxID=1650 RepID=A0A8B4QCQ6_9BACL|nr:MalY/PatB family protein [Kurthia zopfii]PWI23580.1 pyridoxal phosphate-dependent aminotransferase [Kurthia zopfii]TDR42739.1 cystathionine beta-lyase [Kurthia zopfii]GEK30212.1 cystathionine beta-lyase PatB [Kurthia zopfii]STX10424.1 Cystathionine beta-lyase PatB [Kurthia zopfii]